MKKGCSQWALHRALYINWLINRGTTSHDTLSCTNEFLEICYKFGFALIAYSINLSAHFPWLFIPLLCLKFILISHSFSSAQSLCLSDEPRAVEEYRYPEQLPGELYDADTQCKWQFGEKAKLCTLDFKKVNWIWHHFVFNAKQAKKSRVM